MPNNWIFRIWFSDSTSFDEGCQNKNQYMDKADLAMEHGLLSPALLVLLLHKFGVRHRRSGQIFSGSVARTSAPTLAAMATTMPIRSIWTAWPNRAVATPVPLCRTPCALRHARLLLPQCTPVQSAQCICELERRATKLCRHRTSSAFPSTCVRLDITVPIM